MQAQQIIITLAIAAVVVWVGYMIVKKSKNKNKMMQTMKRRLRSGRMRAPGRVVSPIGGHREDGCPECQSGYTTSYTQYKDNHRSRGPIREGFMNTYTGDVPVFNEQLTVTGEPPFNSPFTGALQGELAENPYDGVNES